MHCLVIVSLASAVAMAGDQSDGGLQSRSQWLQRAGNGDWVFDNGHYLMRFARRYGYSAIEVRNLQGSGERLDQFWSTELTFSPMCRFFDNVSFMDTQGGEIQGYLTHYNSFVQADATETDGLPTLVLKGRLQRRNDGARGCVQFEKTLVFRESHYDATLSVRAPSDHGFWYAHVWFDVNDEWCNRYANSAGDVMALRPGVADAEESQLTLRSIDQLDRGYGVWLSVGGAREEILIALPQPDELRRLPHAGVTIFDGPDEADPGHDSHQSHECMALAMIGAGLPQPAPLEPNELTLHYGVHFLATRGFPTLYGSH